MTDPQAHQVAREIAELAAQLSTMSTVPETVDMVLSYAAGLVGADAATVMLLHRRGRGIEVAGTTSAVAERADVLQLETGQGPCVDAARDLSGVDQFVIDDTSVDTRWPVWCKRIDAELGIGAVLSVHLGVPGRGVGALNFYAGTPGRFGAEDIGVGQLLAQHAAIAVANTRRDVDLWQAIDARRVVGTASGILMERFRLTEDQAFAVLRRYSQNSNRKLHEIAQQLIDTRELPPDPPDRASDDAGRAGW